MDTRLINQVVEWEWRIQMENEKKNNYHLETYRNFPFVLEYCEKIVKSSVKQFINLGRSRILSIHKTEPAQFLDSL